MTVLAQCIEDSTRVFNTVFKNPRVCLQAVRHSTNKVYQNNPEGNQIELLLVCAKKLRKKDCVIFENSVEQSLFSVDC